MQLGDNLSLPGATDCRLAAWFYRFPLPPGPGGVESDKTMQPGDNLSLPGAINYRLAAWFYRSPPPLQGGYTRRCSMGVGGRAVSGILRICHLRSLKRDLGGGRSPI